MKKFLNGGIGAGLEQEDWDFSGCPKGREGECWCYEYAREVPAILAAFDEEKKNPQAFDSHGNWFYEHSWWKAGEEDESLMLMHVPPGFPGVPFLRTKPMILEPEARIRFPAKVRSAEEGETPWRPEQLVRLILNWAVPDTELVKAFRQWLRENRRQKPLTCRGYSWARKCLADLRALGAWRLLKHMTAPEAMEYVKGFRCTVYSKLPDWYEAKNRVRKVLRDHFGAGWPKVGKPVAIINPQHSTGNGIDQAVESS
jgi:hypothetical protein